MNFLLFRGTFLDYSQHGNTVEDSCKSLGQMPRPDKEQSQHLWQRSAANVLQTIETKNLLPYLEAQPAHARSEAKTCLGKFHRAIRLTCFVQPANVSTFVISIKLAVVL